MKKFLAIATLLVVTLTFATAQERRGGGRNMGTPEERAKAQTDRLNELVKLTDDQKTKIQAFELEQAKKMSTVMQENREDREAMRTKMQEMDKERDKKYKEILTADQYKKYTEDKAKREKERQERQAQRQRQN
ncbi:MAG: hypothetical protein LBQ60_16990 [Bacteroidales bacterium]|jgi:Spy/CpxP family protein refolding chaperone|nr:hypothetical protein [Bacteroidales bacterium]